jgi:hypothetical protein
MKYKLEFSHLPAAGRTEPLVSPWLICFEQPLTVNRERLLCFNGKVLEQLLQDLRINAAIS